MREKFNIRVLAATARKYNLSLIYLFGSYARGDTHAGSDIDIAYRARRPLTFVQQYNLKRTLAAGLHLSENTIDLVDLASAPPLLAYLVVTEGRKLYGAAASDDALYRRALKRYLDAKPLFRLAQEYVHSQINF